MLAWMINSWTRSSIGYFQYILCKVGFFNAKKLMANIVIFNFDCSRIG